jgi:hypothetical protein
MTNKISESVRRVLGFVCLAGLFIAPFLSAEALAATLNVPVQYTTVQSAFDAAQSGDTILLAAGTYNETVSTKRDGTSSARIVLDGQNVATVRKLNLANKYITVQKTKFAGLASGYTSYIYLDYNAHYAIIQDCTIDMGGEKSVGAIQWRATNNPPFGSGEVASYAVVTRNDIKNGKAAYIISMAGDYNIFSYNYVHDLTQADFVGLFGRNNYIGHNIFSNDLKEEGLGWHSDFIQTFGNNCHGSQGHIIEDNYIYNIIDGGIAQLEGNLVPGIGGWIFRNNIFVAAGTTMSITIPNLKIYNNIFYYNAKGGSNANGPISVGKRYYAPGAGGCNGQEGTNYANGVKVYNNVILDNGCCNNTNLGWYSFDTSLTDVAADYNYVARTVNGVPYTAVDVNPLHQAVGDPGGWNVWKWWEPHGINGGNPNFIQISADCGITNSCNFRLQADSMLINAGLDLSPVWSAAKDYDGISRPQGTRWDIGPYEYTGMVLVPSAPTNLRVLQP